MSSGYQATQACHAALSFAVSRHNRDIARWEAQSNTLVLLTVPNRYTLEDFRDDYCDGQCRYMDFYEPDIGNEITAVALFADTEVVQCYLRRLPLALPTPQQQEGGEINNG